jgi:hypothetical protein
MTRVSIHIDDTNPLEPKAILTVNGFDMPLSEKEFMALYNEVWWARDVIKNGKKHYYAHLATKYKDVQNA